ncbi:MAG: hypothetical protein JJU33_03305 [Phycisphaerales bacterium]|nr:hypothetical protein [Phycisphaerales bacterium]
MPVSGLILSLSDDRRLRDGALEAINQHNAVSLGEMQGLRLPIVVDTADSDADREVWKWLHELPGVLFVDLVCTDASDDAPQDTNETQTDHPLNRTGRP